MKDFTLQKKPSISNDPAELRPFAENRSGGRQTNTASPRTEAHAQQLLLSVLRFRFGPRLGRRFAQHIMGEFSQSIQPRPLDDRG
jgi:hypothetical protein